ncbi:MAG: DUF6812 domain-containing protein [Solirubrobacteraceae bacterium]
MDHREERIVIETNRHRMAGVLRLPRDGYRSRMSDYLNASERGFLALTEVELERLDGKGAVERHAFVVVSLRHIVYARPAETGD